MAITLRKIITPFLKRLLGRRIWSGIFRGMRYTGQNSGSTLMPKILGTYECELNAILRPLLKIPNLRLMDIGAAEGYYTIGVLFSNPSATAVAFEMNPDARAMLTRLAQENRVADRLLLFGECTPLAAEEIVAEHNPNLLIMDVEGAEYALLTPNLCRALSEAHVIVEIHPWTHENLLKTIHARLAATHKISQIVARHPSASDITLPLWRILASLSNWIETQLLQERPNGMSWLIAKPIESSSRKCGIPSDV